MLDVRWPIGSLFTALGLLLAGYGFATARDLADNARALSVNINLWWGLVMLAFGLALLLGAWLAGRTHPRKGVRSSEGEATERRERQLGLERDTR